MKKQKLLVIVCLSVIGIFCTNKINALSSPESVFQYFVSYLKNGNIDAVINLSPFIHDNLVKKIDPKAEILYMDTLLPQDNLIFPIDSIRKYNLLSLYGSQIKGFISSILLPQEFSDYVNYSPVPVNEDENKINRFISALNVQNLTSLELIRFDIFSPETQFSERGRRFIELQKQIYGFDERAEYSILYRHNGKYYAGTMTVVKYGKDWYILALNSLFANTSISGAIELVSGTIDYMVKFKLKE